MQPWQVIFERRVRATPGNFENPYSAGLELWPIRNGYMKTSGLSYTPLPRRLSTKLLPHATPSSSLSPPITLIQTLILNPNRELTQSNSRVD